MPFDSKLSPCSSAQSWSPQMLYVLGKNEQLTSILPHTETLMSVATINETQGPPASQDTDIVTEIENFTADVFALKSNWEQTYIAMDLLPSTIKSDLKYTYNVRNIQIF